MTGVQDENQKGLSLVAIKIMSSLCLFAFLLGIYFLIDAQRQAQSCAKLLENEHVDFEKRLAAEVVRARQDWSEKYAADMVSFQAMKARVEREKQMVVELEKQYFLRSQ